MIIVGDGNPAPVDMVDIHRYPDLLQGFIHPRWCRISSAATVVHDFQVERLEESIRNLRFQTLAL